MQNFKTELKAVSAALGSLSESIAVLVKAVDNSAKATEVKQATEIESEIESDIEPSTTQTTKAATPSTTSSKASTKRRPVSRSKRNMTDTDRVIGIIKRAKRGVNIAELRKKTQFDAKKISNIVHRAHKANRIKKLGRGFYGIAEN